MNIYIATINLDIDVNALELSEKILLITFVVLSTISNFIFIFFIICRHGMQAFTQSRYTIRLAMAVGGILFGMFPMLIFAVHFFEQEDDMFSCITFTLARIYQLEFIHVLYSFGFIILAVDIVVRSKIIQSRKKSSQLSRFMTTPFAIVAGLLPWLGALTLVCPLTLTDMDWDDNCHSQQTRTHIKAQYIVCGIALPCTTLVIAMFCAFLSKADSENLYDFDNPMAIDDTCLQDISALTFATSHSNRGNKYLHDSERQNINDTNSLDAKSGSTNVDAFNSATNPSTDAKTSKDIVINKHVSSFGCHENDALYDRNKIRLESLIILVCSVVFIITVVPYNSIIVFIMDNSLRSPAFKNYYVYETNTEIFIAFVVLSALMTVNPSLVPLLSLAV